MLWVAGNVLINLADKESLPSLEVAWRQERVQPMTSDSLMVDTLVFYVRVIWPNAEQSCVWQEKREDILNAEKSEMEVELFSLAVEYVHSPAIRFGECLLSRRRLTDIHTIKIYHMPASMMSEEGHVVALNYSDGTQSSVKCGTEREAKSLERMILSEISILCDPAKFREAVVKLMAKSMLDRDPEARPLRMIDMEGGEESGGDQA